MGVTRRQAVSSVVMVGAAAMLGTSGCAMASPQEPTEWIRAYLYDDGSLELGGEEFQPNPNKTMVERFPDYIEARSHEDASEWASGVTLVRIKECICPKTLSKAFLNMNNITTFINISNIDTSQCEDMSHMFAYCSSLGTVDISSFDTSVCRDMNHMFSFCEQLRIVDVSGFDTSACRDMSYMFSNCTSLKIIGDPEFASSTSANTAGMFNECDALLL